MNTRLKIVMDTNVLVAGLRSRSGASHELLNLLEKREFSLQLSVPVMIQYQDLLARQQDSLLVTAEEAAIVLETLGLGAEFHNILFLWRHVLPDHRDAAFLELAVAARAYCIVTYNVRHFYGSAMFGIRILTPVQLLKVFGDLS